MTQIKKNNLEEYITAHGAKYGEEKNNFFQEADVFVFPTFYNNECFPLVLLEAMEQGIPCISTEEGGIPSIIEDNKTGYIIQKQSPRELAEKIDYFIQNPDKCISMGNAGRERFKQEFNLSSFENHIIEILKQVASN